MPASIRSAAIALCALAAGPSAGQFLQDPPVEARLVEGYAEAADARIAALRLDLEEGWKTYWRAPGEAGIAPRLDWSGSENLAEAEPLWPAPKIFSDFDVTSYGYEGDVTIPLRIRAEDPARPVRLRLVFDYGLCAEICAPAQSVMTLDIAPDAPERGRAPIAAALDRRPLSAAAAGVVEARCALRGAGDSRAFAAEIAFADPLDAAPHVVIEGPEGVWFGPADASSDGASLSVAAEARLWGEIDWVARDALRLTLLFDGWAAELPGCRA